MLRQPFLLRLWNFLPTRQKYYDFFDGRGPVRAHRHTNPDRTLGGWVADTAQVAPTAFVDVNACVMNQARLLGRARLADESVLCGNAVACDEVSISGRCVIGGGVIVKDNAQLHKSVRADGFAEVTSNTVLEGNVRVGGVNVIIDGAHISGYVEISGETPQKAMTPFSQKELLQRVFSADGLRDVTNYLVIKGENGTTRLHGYGKIVGRPKLLNTVGSDYFEFRDDVCIIESEFSNQAKALNHAVSIRSKHTGDSVIGGHTHVEESEIQHGVKLLGFYKITKQCIADSKDISKASARSTLDDFRPAKRRTVRSLSVGPDRQQGLLPL
jgi:carbonic anhydrase/acetyltransferase-like protein (isoleucine patch superfamily)